MVDLFRYRHWDLVSKRWLYFVISGVMLLAGMFALATRGLNFGVDFKGGGLLTYRIDGRLSSDQSSRLVTELRESLEEQGVVSEVKMSPATAADRGGDSIIILAKLRSKNSQQELDSNREKVIEPTVVTMLGKQQLKIAPGHANQPNSPESIAMIDGSVSKEFIQSAIVALVFGSLLIMLWIGIRYNIGGFGFRYSAGSIIALLHDLLVLIGIFAILRDYLQVNSPFIAALLTILGYSIHDTIIIYDRIRENIRLRKGRTFAETVNISLLETLARSVNTVLTVVLTLLALFFFGGPTLRDFVAALLIGMIVGTYSSIFIASQLLVSWANGKEKLMPTDPQYAIPEPASISDTAPAVATATAAPSAARTEIVTKPAAPPTASREAIQRARQAGKTSKRR